MKLLLRRNGGAICAGNAAHCAMLRQATQCCQQKFDQIATGVTFEPYQVALTNGGRLWFSHWLGYILADSVPSTRDKSLTNPLRMITDIHACYLFAIRVANNRHLIGFTP